MEQILNKIWIHFVYSEKYTFQKVKIMFKQLINYFGTLVILVITDYQNKKPY